jgi:hypothetical protein
MKINLVKLAEKWLDIYSFKINTSKYQRHIVLDFARWLEMFIDGKEKEWEPKKEE